MRLNAVSRQQYGEWDRAVSCRRLMRVTALLDWVLARSDRRADQRGDPRPQEPLAADQRRASASVQWVSDLPLLRWLRISHSARTF